MQFVLSFLYNLRLLATASSVEVIQKIVQGEQRELFVYVVTCCFPPAQACVVHLEPDGSGTERDDVQVGLKQTQQLNVMMMGPSISTRRPLQHHCLPSSVKPLGRCCLSEIGLGESVLVEGLELNAL